MDNRFNKTTAFHIREKELSKSNIKTNLDKILNSVKLLNNWTFLKSEWGVPEVKKSEELRKNIVDVLKIYFSDSINEHVYTIQVPRLINNQFFYIGGSLKVPSFQLYDVPIIYKPSKRKNVVKLKTNVLSMTLNNDKVGKDGDNLIYLFKKYVPFTLLLTNVHTKEEILEFLSGYEDNEYKEQIITCCSKYWDMKEQDRIEMLGKYYKLISKHDKEKKGKSIIFSLKLAYEMDHFSKKFFKTKSLLFEIMNAKFEGTRSDTDYSNKRIRVLEYILQPLMAALFNMMVSLNNNKKIRFKISQSIILDKCNVSDIVKFHSPLNPVEEIASLLQCSITGPGGFKKDNVPDHIRNIDETQYGLICPSDTPDREGCGVVLNMVPNVDFNDDLTFKKPERDDIITSYPISLVPFIENDDQTRLQMASGQLKQSLFLRDSDIPNIRSGTEDLFLEYTNFIVKADNDGEIIYLDDTLMIVKYINNAINTYKVGYVNLSNDGIDFRKPIFKEGERFSKGDLLVESQFIKDSHIAMGRELLTAVCTWKGYNFEDAIVIRESVSDKLVSIHSIDLSFNIDPGQVLLSLKNDEYSPLPNVGDKLKKGDVYAKIKDMIDSDKGIEFINKEELELNVPVDCEITSIEVFPNLYYKQIPEFTNFINEKTNKQTEKFNNIVDSLEKYINNDEEQLSQFLTLNNISKFDPKHKKYVEKGKKIKGIQIIIKAKFEEKAGIGDKLANRHGNKGIISLVLPDDKMPKLEDGRVVDIIINYMGIPSRMNLGQLYECHLNEALHQFKKHLKSIDGRKRIKVLKDFLEKIDKTENKNISEYILNEYKNNKNNNGEDFAIDNIKLIMPCFECISVEELFDLVDYCNSTLKQKLVLPSDDVEIENLVTVGYIHFLKLVHRASDKISARSIGPYNKNTLQPLGGKSNKSGPGGHRLGEMENWALMGHGVFDFMKDLLTVHSDSPGLKNKLLANILQNPDLATSDNLDNTPQSLRLFNAYLRSIGLVIE